MIAVLMALALVQAQPAGDDTPPDLEELRSIYQTSCGNRAYGAFDDVCNQLQDQVRQAEAAADRAARDAKRKAEKEAREAKAHPHDPAKTAQTAPASPPAPLPPKA